MVHQSPPAAMATTYHSIDHGHRIASLSLSEVPTMPRPTTRVSASRRVRLAWLRANGPRQVAP